MFRAQKSLARKIMNQNKALEKNAQGAIEYLLIIGAAILVTAIVIIAATSGIGTGKTAVTNSQNEVTNTLETLRNMENLGTSTIALAANGSQILPIYATGLTVQELFPSIPASVTKIVIKQNNTTIDTYSSSTGSWTSGGTTQLIGVYDVNLTTTGSTSITIPRGVQATNINGACGTAAKNYSASETFPTGNFCDANSSPVILTPSLLGAFDGNKVTWDCNGYGTGTKKACEATRKLPTLTLCEVPTQATRTLLYPAQISCTFTGDTLGHSGTDYVAMIKPSTPVQLSITNPKNFLQLIVWDENSNYWTNQGSGYTYFDGADTDDAPEGPGWYDFSGGNKVGSPTITNNQRFMLLGIGGNTITLTLTPAGNMAACPLPAAGVNYLSPNKKKYDTPINCSFVSSIGTFDTSGYRTSYITLKGHDHNSLIKISPSVPGIELGYDVALMGYMQKYYYCTQAMIDNLDCDELGWTGGGGIYPVPGNVNTLDLTTSIPDLNFYIKVPVGNTTPMTLTITQVN